MERELEAVAALYLGRGPTRIERLAPGLGSRSFYRLHFAVGPPSRVIARVESRKDAPAAGSGPEPPLEPLRGVLAAAGIPVPRSYGHDPQRGIDLLEDLGDRSLAREAAVADPERLRALYREACGIPARLQRIADPGPATAARHLDRDLLRFKEARFVATSLPIALGRAPSASECRVVREGFNLIAEAVAEAPERLAHRDFQSSNLMLARRGEREALVLIDLQGAFFAPPEYDLVCLLRDSYVELPRPLRSELAEAARIALPDAPDRATFERRFDLLTLARKAKDHAFFLAAAARGDGRYLGYLASTARALREAGARLASRDARHAPFAALLDRAALEKTP